MRIPELIRKVGVNGRVEARQRLRQRLRRHLGPLCVLVWFSLVVGPVPLVGAQIKGLDDWSDAIAAGFAGRWKGQRVPVPEMHPRPMAATPSYSAYTPTAVHAGPTVTLNELRVAHAALDAAVMSFERMGFGTSPGDAGRGDTAGFDLYLVEGSGAPQAFMDDLELQARIDQASTFAVVDPSCLQEDAFATVLNAYAQAQLMALDPAEAPAWRRATAAYLSYVATEGFGCHVDPFSVQAKPHLSFLDEEEGDGSGGALLLMLLAELHASGAPTLVRDLWEMARQHTWEGADLRGSPDLFEALNVSVERSPIRFDEMLEDFAVARFFAAERSAPGPMQSPREWPIAPPLLADLRYQDLPRQTPVHDPGLETWGSSYTRIDVSQAPPQSRLRLWLRGEYGVRWSFVAVRLDADGKELGRVSAPPREVPKSYVLVELLDNTAEVIVVVTNLSSRLPDADVRDENVRSFKIIADK